MIIKFSPVRMDETITASKQGDVLTINGQAFDLSPLPDGATLPVEAIGSDHFVGPVERTDGVLHLTIRLPHGPNPPPCVAFPEPITVTKDGPVKLPTDEVGNDD
jgi:hypothetical protein